jgi:hypothetical protein
MSVVSCENPPDSLPMLYVLLPRASQLAPAICHRLIFEIARIIRQKGRDCLQSQSELIRGRIQGPDQFNEVSSLPNCGWARPWHSSQQSLQSVCCAVGQPHYFILSYSNSIFETCQVLRNRISLERKYYLGGKYLFSKY